MASICTLSKCGFVIIQAQAMPNNKSLFGIMVLLRVLPTTQNALPKQGGFWALMAPNNSDARVTSEW